jgi:hypothetical protein
MQTQCSSESWMSRGSPWGLLFFGHLNKFDRDRDRDSDRDRDRDSFETNFFLRISSKFLLLAKQLPLKRILPDHFMT